VASADSLTALIPLAVEAVRIAFRTGAHVGRVAQQLECDTQQKSWSTIVAADASVVEVALSEFHEANVSPPGLERVSKFSLADPGI
jgi:Starter unit:ACP transacylase in aflatoxin biosynthesis